MINIDDFKKVEIKVGTIKSVEEIEGSEKLYKFSIDLGEPEPRQVLGGLKLSYQPDELVGKQVLIAANLEPRKLMGLESQGMILAASDSEGKPVIVSPIKDVGNGTVIK